MNWALSWTDEFFLGLLILVFLMIVRGLRRENMRFALKSIFKRPIAVSAAVVLAFFLIISVLDSIHLKNGHDDVGNSLLDQILSPLDTVYEQSYSKPFALTLYSTELVMEGESAQQVYLPLTYPPQSMQTEHDVWSKVKEILIKVFMVTFGFLLVLVGMLFLFNLSLNQAGRAALITLFLLIWASWASFELSRSFHILGTGQVGQDIFYYTLKSIRTGVVIGSLTTLFMMPLALFAGIAAGYFGGVVDDVIQYLYTTLSSIPGVLLITASVLSLQTYIAVHPEYFKTLAQSADARLLALCVILGVTSWTSLCRLLRAEVLKLREIDFVLAAQALGSSVFFILRKHLLPNVMYIVIITMVLDFSFLVLAEAVLSYVGVGVSPMTISWGNMINAARLELARDPIVWWPVFAAFTMMFTLVLASNLFADAVREAFDPHESVRLG